LEIVQSTTVIGTLTKAAAYELGLPQQVKVVAGGVDNSCMAVGARNIKDGRVYNNQGSSSGIAITSKTPIMDKKIRPFVFSAVIPELFNSAVPVFSAGTSFRWVKDQFCQDLIEIAKKEHVDVYDLMTSLAKKSPVGSKGIMFNPNLAGGSSVDASTDMRGGFSGLDLGHSRSDLIRSAMEGIALELGMALEQLRKAIHIGDEMVVVGGGSRSPLWRQIYADVYKMRIIKTNIDQQAAALGAAALAAVGTGLWDNFDIIDEIVKEENVTNPNINNMAIYEKIQPVFIKMGELLGKMSGI
jgi:xylulokinase